MTTAELIVRTLELARGNSCEESDLGSKQLMYADRIKDKYRAYKTAGMDFTGAALRARVEIIEEILKQEKE